MGHANDKWHFGSTTTPALHICCASHPSSARLTLSPRSAIQMGCVRSQAALVAVYFVIYKLNIFLLARNSIGSIDN